MTDGDFGIPRIDDGLVTRRFYLTMQALEAGADPMLAIEAVSTTALEHPEWDMDERRTLQEWASQADADSAST